MATAEERIAFLEGKVEVHSKMLDGIRDAIVHLEQRIDRRFEAVDGRLVQLEHRMDVRFEAVDRRFEGIDHRLDGIDQKLSTQFRWLVGILVTALTAMSTLTAMMWQTLAR